MVPNIACTATFLLIITNMYYNIFCRAAIINSKYSVIDYFNATKHLLRLPLVARF